MNRGELLVFGGAGSHGGGGAGLKAGFVRSGKTWKSHGILKWSFPGLEKSRKKLKS